MSVSTSFIHNFMNGSAFLCLPLISRLNFNNRNIHLWTTLS